VRSVEVIVHRASQERYGAPLDDRPFTDREDRCGRLSPNDRRQPPPIVDFHRQHNVAGG